jgi:hypothetical protein
MFKLRPLCVRSTPAIICRVVRFRLSGSGWHFRQADVPPSALFVQVGAVGGARPADYVEHSFSAKGPAACSRPAQIKARSLLV